jgi:hypothetical protein
MADIVFANPNNPITPDRAIVHDNESFAVSGRRSTAAARPSRRSTTAWWISEGFKTKRTTL